MHERLFIMVPINVSSYDLQENQFTSTKLVNVTLNTMYPVFGMHCSVING